MIEKTREGGLVSFAVAQHRFHAVMVDLQYLNTRIKIPRTIVRVRLAGPDPPLLLRRRYAEAKSA